MIVVTVGRGLGWDWCGPSAWCDNVASLSELASLCRTESRPEHQQVDFT